MCQISNAIGMSTHKIASRQRFRGCPGGWGDFF
jgi:hypothetical protein